MGERGAINGLLLQRREKAFLALLMLTEIKLPGKTATALGKLWEVQAGSLDSAS